MGQDAGDGTGRMTNIPGNVAPKETPKEPRKTKQQQTINQYIGKVLPNILDDYDNSTYNIKLYMIGPGEASTSASNPGGTSSDNETSSAEDDRKNQGNSGSLSATGTGWLNDNVRATPDNTVVLAQTGVTEVGIDNLEILTVPGGEGGSEASRCNFTITQPLACDFPDQIVRARTYLGMPADAMDAPMFLEINFVGYTESDLNESKWDTDKGGQPQVIKGPYILPILLKNFSMNIDAGGSTYDFETVVKDDVASANIFYRLDKLFTISGDSIYEMLADLEQQVNDYKEKLNKPERINFGLSGPTEAQPGAKDGDDPIPATQGTVPGLDLADQSLDVKHAENVGKIIFPKFAKAVDTKAADEETEKARIPSVTFEGNPDDNLVAIDLKAQMTLDKALGIILSMNKEFMEKSNRSKMDPTSKEVDTNKQVMWYKYIPSISYGEFDKEKKEYRKTANFIPQTYLSPRSDIAVMPEELIKTQNPTKEEARTKLNQMEVRKAYEYIFTGRNDQILDVNIQYNEGIALLLPTERGLLGDVSLNASSVLNSTSVPKNESAEDGGIDKLNESAKGDGKGFFDALKDLKESALDLIGKAANFNGEQIKDLIENQAGASATKLKNILSDQVSAQAIADSLTPGRKAQAQSNVVTETETFSPGQSGYIYGGDLGLQGDVKYAERLKDGGLQFKDGHPKDDSDKTNSTSGIGLRYEEVTKSGFVNVGTTKGIKNNLFTYLYDQHQAIDFLMKLDLTLRGDPWWLGREPMQPGSDKIPTGMAADKVVEDVEDSDNYLTTTRDNFFLFSMNSPRLFDANVEDEDANTGLWNQKDDGTSYFLSGIYQVRKVVHNFNMGEYKLDVEGIKETAINLDQIGRDYDKGFRITDDGRTGLSSRRQDGVSTQTENESFGNKGKSPAYIKGYKVSSGKTVEEMKKDGDINQEEYDAFKSNEKNGAGKGGGSGGPRGRGRGA